MTTLTIQRTYYPSYTRGDVLTETGEILIKTQELPNLGNKNDISCIPEGKYICKRFRHPVKGWIYKVLNVVNRSYIYFHSGNFTSEILGCIETGDSYGMIGGKPAILNSKAALQKLLNYAGDEFTLIITS